MGISDLECNCPVASDFDLLSYAESFDGAGLSLITGSFVKKVFA